MSVLDHVRSKFRLRPFDDDDEPDGPPTASHVIDAAMEQLTQTTTEGCKSMRRAHRSLGAEMRRTRVALADVVTETALAPNAEQVAADDDEG